MTDRIAASVLIAISLAFIGMAFAIQRSFFTDPVGAKFVPIFVGVFLIGACVALLLRPRSHTQWPDAATWRRLLICLAGFIGYGLLMNPLGFIASTTIAFTLFALLFHGKPLRSVLAGAGFAVASYLLFSLALDLYLPTGRIFEGLF